MREKKRRFGFLLRADEHQALQRLAQATDRSQGAMLRRLIREEAQRRGLWVTGQRDWSSAEFRGQRMGQ